MGYVSNWLQDHNFHSEDMAESRETLITFWEMVLLVALVVTLISTMIVLFAPETAYSILRYLVG